MQDDASQDATTIFGLYVDGTVCQLSSDTVNTLKNRLDNI